MISMRRGKPVLRANCISSGEVEGVFKENADRARENEDEDEVEIL